MSTRTPARAAKTPTSGTPAARKAAAKTDQTAAKKAAKKAATKVASSEAPKTALKAAAKTRAKAGAKAGAVASRKPGVRELAAQATREAILKAAIKVFAKHGYDGGSVEKISQAANSYDRMIYYYFGSKEGLFIEVLEEIYRRMNVAEVALEIDPVQPVQALQRVIAFVLTYYRKHPEFITLLNTENLHKGRHISKSLRAREYSSPAIALIDAILANGVVQGRFRPDVSARNVYLLIASLGYFYLSNRYTLGAFLGENLEDAAALADWHAFVTDTVLRTVSAPGAPA